jgi:VWFA-related protein
MSSHVPALTIAAAIATGVTLSSQQAPPTFRSRADLVQLHVVVRDADGRPVRGLTKDDFALLDAKQPRPIEIFEEVARPALPPALVPAEFPLDVADNRTARASRLVVIVLDDMVVRPYLEQTKALAREAVMRLGKDALIAYLTTSGTDGVEATADHAAVLRAIDRVGTPASNAPRIPRGFGDQTSHATIAESAQRSGPLPGGISMDPRTKNCHLTMLSQAARMVRGDEATRRIFLYITPFCGQRLYPHGVGADGEPSEEDPYNIEMGNLLESMRHSNATLYAMDPRGEVGFRLDQFRPEDIVGAESTPRRVITRRDSPVLNSQDGIRELTAATGGLAVTNSREYDVGFARIEDDLSQYYVLGFYGTDPKPNRYHAVDVKIVNRPEVSVRSRPGYFSGTLPVLEDKDPMVRLAAGAIPAAELPLRLFAVSEHRGVSSRVSVVLEVGWTGLEKPDETGKWNESLDAMVLVTKVMSGKVERKWAMKRPVAVPIPAQGPAGFAAYQTVTEVDLSPGYYQFRVSAKSVTGKTGSVYLAVEVPKSAPLSLGEILVGAPDRISPIVAASPKGVAQLPLPITLDRVFLRTERARFFAKLFQPASSAPPEAMLSFIDTSGKVVHSVDVARPVGSQVLDATVSLNALAPGAYRARLTIGGAAAVATREVSLVIR